MPRLFVAADLPRTSIASLVQIQPPQAAGIRLAAPSQMHLTLHFLGEADLDPIRTALLSVVATAFSIDFKGVGQFPSFGGGMILWAGIQQCDGLIRLHAAVADALSAVGFQPEERPYTPHITLARCKTRQASADVRRFLARQPEFRLPEQRITTFGLYSSTIVNDAPTYRCEQSFPLIANDLKGV